MGSWPRRTAWSISGRTRAAGSARQSLDDLSVAYRDAWEAACPGEPGHTFSPTNPLTRAGEMSLELGRRIDYFGLLAEFGVPVHPPGAWLQALLASAVRVS